jgi:hypothetical protein
MTHRTSTLLVLAAMAGLVTGCGKSSSPSARATPSFATTDQPSPTGSGGPPPGVPALTGPSVPVEIDGYAYTVGPASAAVLATTYTAGSLSATKHDAPPGTDYVLVWVTVTNATTDRQEPVPVYEQQSSDVPADLFGIGVPDKDASRFGERCQDVTGIGVPTSVPADHCGYSAGITAASTIPSDGQIAAGDSVYLQLVVGEVPGDVPLADVSLFVKSCVLGPHKQEGCDGAHPVPVARAS